MIKHYTVAEHTFSLEMSDTCPVWQMLANYNPFEVAAGTRELFCLHVLSDTTPIFKESEAHHVLTDSSDDDMPRIELYEQGGGYLFRVAHLKNAAVCCEMETDSDFSSARLVVFENAVRHLGRFPIDNALMLLYAFSTARMKTLEMHASVVIKDGRCQLFLGKSGTGKSTHSRQWLSLFSDARLLNDDNPIVRFSETEKTWYAYGSPWSGKTPCYVNDKAPIADFVLIKQAPFNRCRLLALPEAYAAVYSSTSGLRCNRRMADGLYEAVAGVVTTVPCYGLECLPNTDAARVCYNEIQAHSL